MASLPEAREDRSTGRIIGELPVHTRWRGAVLASALFLDGDKTSRHKLAKSHHAQSVGASWAGKTPNAIAGELACHPQTVRVHVAGFNEQGSEGLGMRLGSGRKPRLSE